MARRPETSRAGRSRAAALALAAAALGCAQQAAGPSASAPAASGAEEAAPSGSQGTQLDIPAQASPLASALEIARRALTPLTYQEVQRGVAAGKALRDPPVDAAQESIAVYLPAGPPPPRGYGLLVYVAPWEEATRPRRWRAPLDRRGIIFASAARAGNETGLLDRRVPVAVLAAETVRARYPVDPERVYVGGMSGGSRSAQVIALAYPDLFRGALLNAGSEPIDGTGGVYIPPAELFGRFQATRLVYVSGEKDEEALRADHASRQSMKQRCVLGLETLTAYRIGHEPIDAPTLDRALELLERRPRPDPAALARCNAALERELAERLREAEAAVAAGERERARALLREIDARYGGLAAPTILELDARRAGMR